MHDNFINIVINNLIHLYLTIKIINPKILLINNIKMWLFLMIYALIILSMIVIG